MAQREAAGLAGLAGLTGFAGLKQSLREPAVEMKG